MKITHAQLEKRKADGIAEAMPFIKAAAAKAVAAARASGATGRAIAKLNNPRTSSAKADEQAREAARLMLTGPRMPVPTRQQIESVTQKNASDHESVLGAMRVARLQRAGKM